MLASGQPSADEALAQDARARAGPYGSSLGHFVAPSSRLREIATSTCALPPSIAVVLDRHLDAALSDVREFTATRVAAVDTPSGINVERGQTLERILDWSAQLDDRYDLYCEIFGTETRPEKIDDAVESLAVIRRKKRNVGAKMPLRGASSTAVAHALSACARHNVPVKAGPGVRFPLRPSDGASHGILNLLVAAAVAFRDSEARSAIVTALEDDDPSAFALEEDALTWRGRRFGAATIASVRREMLLAFASYHPTGPGEQLSDPGVLT